ncbi:DUF4352 domain-containing protein [Microbacterium sp. M28]|uniref:DUF4352 domain-containing protein n=1 Tax=Microbacterium sp. M28 TaxID=2962064 RepID=UPI0021F48C3C|nr:DUF4352 domain-containing protein [Microbacterium sp. M28]UYO97530.1 DUF4352 domain-containing protein [Microbacterium sp. M28]
MNRALPWLLTAALLVSAWLVALVTPDDSAFVAPFVVRTSIGEEAVGRDLALTVQDVRMAESISAPGGWTAEGTWLLVDVDAEATLEQYGTLLGGATLTIGDRSFRASDRPESIFKTRLVTGIPKSGTIAFELPADALSGTGILQLSSQEDTRADSVIELEIDLDALDPVADAEIPKTDWTNP